jgi:hypothetical protein
MGVVVTVLVQLIVSLLVVGAVMPALLAAVPAARSSHTGLTVAIVGALTVFGLLRLLWPHLRPKRR